jgi:hypothetical protein
MSKLPESPHFAQMSLTKSEFDLIITGLRLLQYHLCNYYQGATSPELFPNTIKDLLSEFKDICELSSEEANLRGRSPIDNLCVKINTSHENNL